MLAAEAVCRLRAPDTLIYRDSADPDLRFEPIPLREGTVEGAEVHLNSRGLRDREYSVPKPAAVKARFLVLGDSVVFGRAVRGADVFPELWEERLGPSFEVVNAAVCAYTSEQSLEFFEKRLADLKPDGVLLTVSSDHLDPPRRRLMSRFPGLKNFVREHSALARTWMEGAYRRRGSPSDGGLHAAPTPSRRRRAAAPAKPPVEVSPELLARAEEIVRHAKESSVKVGHKLAVLYVPRLDRYQLHPEDAEKREAFRRAAASQGVTLWDATATLTTGVVTALLKSPHSAYLNEKGHAAVAAFLMESGRKERWF